MQYHLICKVFNLFRTSEVKLNVIWTSGSSATAVMEILEVRETGSQKIAYIFVRLHSIASHCTFLSS